MSEKNSAKRPFKTKIPPAILFGLGAAMVSASFSRMASQNKATTEYLEVLDPLVERMVGPPSQEEEDRRYQLLELFQNNLSPEEFSKNVDLINRSLLPSPMPEDQMEQLELRSKIQSLESRTDNNSLPGGWSHGVFIGTGIALFVSGAWLDHRLKPKPTPPPPPSQEWDSAPPVSLNKRAEDASNS